MSVFKIITKSLLLMVLLSNVLHAANTFPRGCEVSGFAYNNNNLIINDNGEQSFYLIQNRSEGKIELERHETTEAFMSPPLLASFDALNWAAFASDVQNLNFKCYKHEGETTAVVDCRDVLEVCRYPRVRFALSNMGNYWISTNKPQNEVIQDAVAKGIYLKW